MGLALAAVAAVGFAQAAVEIGKDAKVVARAYGELPPESRITVEIPNESDVNIWVRDNVVTDLRQRGYQIVDDASLVLKLNSEVRSANEDGSRFSLEGDRGVSRFNTLQLGVRLPLGERKSQANQTHINISATLGERGRSPIWQGTASALALHHRALEVQPALVASLVDSIGKTVGGETY